MSIMETKNSHTQRQAIMQSTCMMMPLLLQLPFTRLLFPATAAMASPAASLFLPLAC